MTAALDHERLAKLLGMLGSAHDGEVLAAARQTARLRQGAGLTWRDIVLPALPPPARAQRVETLAAAIAFALDHEDALTPWEFGFVTSLRRQRTPISAKQAAILEQIVEKAQRAEARAA
jgi:hypothetical protein